jgi:TonB family protein
MGYQALLFCPDEKTARTVTQVLSELEFSVEPCVETFAAVKKLMSTHFDAVVVDCDNEQNATLLFKSARNSASNQTSLAVAVVEGQAGVAKAFRIGANLVLTKPINIEQAKGTLRVARGLLRKGEPGKPGAPASASTPVSPVASALPAKPAAPKPVPAKAPEPAVAATPRPAAPPAPAPAWPTNAAVASSAPAAHGPASPDDEPLGISINQDVPVAPTPLSHASSLPASPVPAATAHPKPAAKSAPQTGSFTSLSIGAASAPAPARDKNVHAAESSSAGHSAATLDLPADAKPLASAHATAEPPVPSFTFGGNATAVETSGGSKKILLVVGAIVIVAAAAYAAWTFFQGRTSQPVPSPSSAPATQPLTAKPTPSPPATASTASAPSASPASQPAEKTTAANESPTESKTESRTESKTGSRDDNIPKSADETAPSSLSSARTSSKNSSKPTPAARNDVASAPATPEPAPLVVKGGAAPKTHAKTEVADLAPPSVPAIATPGAGAPPPDLVNAGADAPTPLLQSTHISQGVSQGLLIKKVQPIYPKIALTMHIEGEVQLGVTISKTGNITNIKVITGDPQLARAAIDAVRQWKYKPYLLDGEPVEIQTIVTLNFRTPN